MTAIGAVSGDDAHLPIDERRALLGTKRRMLCEENHTRDRQILEKPSHYLKNATFDDGPFQNELPTRISRRKDRAWNIRLASISASIVMVVFVCAIRKYDSRTSASPEVLRSAKVADSSSSSSSDNKQEASSQSSTTFILDDVIFDRLEEWKVPSEDVRSGNIWKEYLPSLHHVWRETMTINDDVNGEERRLKGSRESADPSVMSGTTADSSISLTTPAVTPKPSRSPTRRPTLSPLSPTVLESPSISLLSTHAPIPAPFVSTPAPTQKPIVETPSPVQHPKRGSSTRPHSHSQTSAAPQVQGSETSAPSTENDVKGILEQDEEKAESWFKDTWHKVSEGAETAWQKAEDEEQAVAAQIMGNRTSDTNVTTTTESNTTWSEREQQWYETFVDDLHKLGDHMRSWWANAENATEDESREIGDWLNSTEHTLAQDERVVQHKFQNWWKNASAAEKVWWKNTVKNFRNFAHRAKEKEKEWWAITRDTAKRDWATVVRTEENVWNKTVNLEHHVVNETKAAWNATSTKAVNSWDWTVDEEQHVWHAIQHWYKAHATYEEELQMPLVYFNSTAAFSSLMNNYGWYDYSQDFFHLQDGWDAQMNQAYCAVATVAAILNSFARDTVSLPVDPAYAPYPYATQANLLNSACVQKTVIHHNETYDGLFHLPGGLTLEQARKLLECHMDLDLYESKLVFLDPREQSLDEVRRDLMLALGDPTTRVFVNFDRRVLGQVGGGHFSPIGSYAEREDSFLIMDVAKYKYPPVWVPAARLYASMATVDKCGHWDFPKAQDKFDIDAANEAFKNETLYNELLKNVNCKEAFRGYIVVRLRR